LLRFGFGVFFVEDDLYTLQELLVARDLRLCFVLAVERLYLWEGALKLGEE
jgi:hypothetical protein